MSEHPLKERRLALGLTLYELAERAGTTAATVHRIESGTRLPSVDLIARLKAATGLSADCFLPRREEARG